jgi:pimeloyl-ACP methyl ester carboxylesterase
VYQMSIAVFGVIIVSAIAASPLSGQQTQTKKEPLILAEQGTFFVGGTIEERKPNSSVKSDSKYVGPGDISINHMYVEYQIPQNLKYKFPIVMMHGGGHSGNVYRSTPDGREGWFTSFARRGFAVYVVDAPNRGRSGWDPTNRFAVGLGEKPSEAMESANIYTAQTAWTNFRIGSNYGAQAPGQQFPADSYKQYVPQLLPSYRDNVQNDYIAKGLAALVDKIGPCILLGWSTGGGNVLVAGTSRVDKVKGLIAVEGVPPNPSRSKVDEMLLAKIPLLSVYGDYLDPVSAEDYAAKLVKLGGDATAIALPKLGIKGNGHVMMVERNSEQIADIIEKWIAEHVKDGLVK